MFSLFCGLLVDRTCFLCVLLMMKSLRGWEFDEMEEKSEATKKRNSYLSQASYEDFLENGQNKF